ncbi:hypothetical protein SPRG_05437 [Saprolegnia parasitica CBS 223.65]|uniref:Endonuclease n=1 Tax=Saprolegnia parasitica (strain CBS 223.65) TaxID=695850 RepID=A0A067CR04_SAPPC|nr:hypothetical protein SPRG_05437 [Saprolegnia parasitica CBS 223.65]KDO29202.1 hypothetical protein SPRG_05437 [Saprolegnia parasitica CBS 223.65]|eukprot:XP_012200072.1 hypothetical protein SPRG_05437 [Saprolegnia parasitica CBS 223.65]
MARRRATRLPLQRLLSVGLGGIVLGAAGTLAAIEFLLPDEDDRPVPTTDVIDSVAPVHEAVRFGAPSLQNVKVREGYVLSYDRRLRNPSWVAEYITKASLEKSPDVNRLKASFKGDLSTPPPFRVTPSEYHNSGYDRGHLAPARDMSTSQVAVNESFLMTNISPQVGKFNRGYWSRVEGFVRHLANQYDGVYVITGPLFLPTKDKKGDGYRVSYPILGTPLNGVAVPTHFFKVVLVAAKPSKTDKAGTKKYLAAGFVLPNEGIAEKTPLRSFLMPLDMIERYAGLLFFEKIDRSALSPLCDDTKCELKAQDFQRHVKAIAA